MFCSSNCNRNYFLLETNPKHVRNKQHSRHCISDKTGTGEHFEFAKITKKDISIEKLLSVK